MKRERAITPVARSADSLVRAFQRRDVFSGKQSEPLIETGGRRAAQPHSRSAELNSAVSRICNPQRVRTSDALPAVGQAAEYNSAIQQIENLRYVGLCSRGQSCPRYGRAWLALLLLGALVCRAQTPDFSWFTVDGGGGSSAVGVYQISGIIGQPDAGVASVASLKLDGGFLAGLTALQPPAITLQPQSQLVGGGSNAVFTVAAIGGLPLGYQWRHIGTNLPAATNALLTLTNVQSADAGLYDLVVSNAYGMTTSAVATLRVMFVFASVNGELLLGSQYAYEGAAVVDLASSFPNGLLFYTLDGSTPDFFSPQYSGPIVINQSALLRTLTLRSDFTEPNEGDPIQFTILPGLVLTAYTPGGGSVAVSPPGDFYPRNAAVTVTATPASGWTFLGWSGDATGTNPMLNLTMTHNLTVQAAFGTPLNVTVSGTGTVARAPALPLHPYGTTVQLTALPGPGSAFQLWGGGVSNPTNNPLTLAIATPNRSISCLFTPLAADQVSLALGVVGAGHVSSNPAGNRFTNGTMVTLTATPDFGQDFLGWSGDALGTNNPLPLLLDSSKTVTAAFTERPRLIAQPSNSARDGQLLFVTGTPGETYALEATGNFNTWTNLATITNVSGTVPYTDLTATNQNARFYRAQFTP